MRPRGILQAMVLLVGIEVAAGRRECRPFALGHLMRMRGMIARRQILEVQLDSHARSSLALAHRGASDALAVPVFQSHGDRLFRGTDGGGTPETGNGSNNNVFGHGVLLLEMVSQNFGGPAPEVYSSIPTAARPAQWRHPPPPPFSC